jgi:hypothetical protein
MDGNPVLKYIHALYLTKTAWQNLPSSTKKVERLRVMLSTRESTEEANEKLLVLYEKSGKDRFPFEYFKILSDVLVESASSVTFSFEVSARKKGAIDFQFDNPNIIEMEDDLAVKSARKEVKQAAKEFISSLKFFFIIFL